MRNALLAIAVLLGFLFPSGQAPVAPPKPPPAAAPITSSDLPITEAGGLDDRCQAGLGGGYNLTEEGFGTNSPKESSSLSSASTCIGFVAGWAETLNDAIIMEDDSLWYVEISDSAAPLDVAVGLHKFLAAHPDARKVPSVLVLLKVATDEGKAKITKVEIKEAPSRGDGIPSTGALSSAL
jgi:hypothetical protein